MSDSFLKLQNNSQSLLFRYLNVKINTKRQFEKLKVASCGERIWSKRRIGHEAGLLVFYHVLSITILLDSLTFLRFYLFVFLGRGKGREREKEGEKHRCERKTLIGCLWHALPLWTKPASQACDPTRNGTSNPSLCGKTPNQVSHAGQGTI